MLIYVDLCWSDWSIVVDPNLCIHQGFRWSNQAAFLYSDLSDHARNGQNNDADLSNLSIQHMVNSG